MKVKFSKETFNGLKKKIFRKQHGKNQQNSQSLNLY